ncbi:phage tail sheath C-terminal domain-containing protein [Streptomyces sp. IB201691-2A2]|uniref:phage tail sheath C-terminal domain-containing protein n=1 Tax=Streptomyces sp. IB201691-2A2 TaxID=2561920 RepID=UPI00117D7C23|nr:phage tail sheath C-terminal domain-containing protein [Streptomyces sp. IB201691-2A2]TRO58524.1 phage tail sheath family protein [Streptomyces sp. IB201691-2A2]
MSTPGLRLGAPGVLHDDRRPPLAFRPVRLDIAGFVGIAPRGPVDTPVAVDSWSDYLRRFGRYEGPGLLPHAVRAFFAQGGTRAHVLRVSPLPRLPHRAAEEAHALHRLALARPGPSGPETAVPCTVGLRARDEGSWGGRLTVRWEFTAAGQFTAAVDGTELTLPERHAPQTGSVLRIRGPGLPATGGFFRVTGLAERQDKPSLRVRVALLDRSPGPRVASVTADIVTATVVVTDADADLPREERLTGLGLDREHPRWAADVLAADSLLVAPDGDWPDTLLPADPLLAAPGPSSVVRTGRDRYADIAADSFHGPLSVELLPVGGEESDLEPTDVPGMDQMALVPEVALLAVPDLLWHHTKEASPAPVVPARGPGPVFAPCPPPEPVLSPAPSPLRAGLLDSVGGLAEITARQSRLVALAERQRRFTALLDVPPRLPVQAVARWRAAFDSSYCAAYHPWLWVVDPEDPGRPAVLVPPSGFAAGVIAHREQRLGLAHGPANVLAVEAVAVAQRLDAADHDELHLLGVNVFQAERDGFRLASARTLSRDPDYRQLSVRRLMTMLRIVLGRQAQPLAFEPHSAQLRAELRSATTELLRGLYRAGALAGDSEEEAFFVHCDERLNPGWSHELGRLVAEVGVAPAHPLEYLVVRISQDVDGSVAVEQP